MATTSIPKAERASIAAQAPIALVEVGRWVGYLSAIGISVSSEAQCLLRRR